MNDDNAMKCSEDKLRYIEILRLALLGMLVERTGEIYQVKTDIECLNYKFIAISPDGFKAATYEDLRISTFDNSGTITDRIKINVNLICNRIRWEREDLQIQIEKKLIDVCDN